MKLHFTIAGVGLIGGGLGGWPHCRDWLQSGGAPGNPDLPQSNLLSARERRRSPLIVRQALSVAEQACAMAGIGTDRLPGVFASGMGDLEITHYLCDILARSPELISPTRFHNSVHNAVAGYWNIAAGTHEDVTALCAHDDSFAAGLTEAVLRCCHERRPVLLVAYDIPAQGLLKAVWPVASAFAGAMVVTPPVAGQPTLALTFSTDSGVTPQLPPELAALALDNPAARLLYVLAMLVGKTPSIVLQTRQGPNLKLCCC